MKNNGFLSMGRGNTIRADLVKNAFQDGKKYFIETAYGETFEVNKTSYNEIKDYLEVK